MSTDSDQDREDRAIDALIVMAFRPELRPGAPPPARPAPAVRLTEADRRILAALGPDFAARLAAWERAPRPRPLGARPRRRGRTTTGALHRAPEDAGLTEE